MALQFDPKILEKYKGALTNSTDLLLKNSIVGILGAQETGKSCLAASISEFWRGVPAPEPITLSDVGWISIEPGSTDSVEGLNYKIPEVIDWNFFYRQHQDPVLATVLSLQFAQAKGYKNLVLDSISDLSVKVEGWLSKQLDHASANAATKEDTQKYYRVALRCINEILETIASYDGLKLVVVHGKADLSDLRLADIKDNEKKAAEKEKLERQDAATNQRASVLPSIVGSAKQVFINRCSLIIGTRKVVEKGQEVIKVSANFDEKADLAVKNRFKYRLKGELPFCVRQIIAAARGEMELEDKLGFKALATPVVA